MFLVNFSSSCYDIAYCYCCYSNLKYLTICSHFVLVLSVFYHAQDRSIFTDSFRISDFRRVTFRGSSTALWDISPPSRMLLMSTLDPNNNTNSIRRTFSWQVSR